MNNVKSISERDREFEQAHYCCQELLEDRIKKIEDFVSKWLVAAIGIVLLVQAAGFTYFYYDLVQLRKKVDHRYFLTKESLEDIHKVRIENGQVLRDYTD